MSKTFATAQGKFEDMMQQVSAERKHFTKQREEAEQEARNAKSKEESKLRELTRLNRIAYLAKWTHDPMVWTDRVAKFEGHERHSGTQVWTYLHSWELETSTLEFNIYVKERLDLKKFKYEVTVQARKRTLSENPTAVNGGYTDHDYGKAKYMTYVRYGVYEEIKGQEMELKFSKLSEADRFAEAWMHRLYEDHKELIDQDRAFRQVCIDSGFQYDSKRHF